MIDLKTVKRSLKFLNNWMRALIAMPNLNTACFLSIHS